MPETSHRQQVATVAGKGRINVPAKSPQRRPIHGLLWRCHFRDRRSSQHAAPAIEQGLRKKRQSTCIWNEHRFHARARQKRSITELQNPSIRPVRILRGEKRPVWLAAVIHEATALPSSSLNPAAKAMRAANPSVAWARAGFPADLLTSPGRPGS